jgi:hypothetical protein
LESFERGPGRCLRRRHAFLELRHRRILGVGDVGACSTWISRTADTAVQ